VDAETRKIRVAKTKKQTKQKQKAKERRDNRNKEGGRRVG